MLTKKTITDILRENIPYLVSEYGIRRIGLFGSYVKGNQNENSDVDIIAEFDKPIGFKFVEFTEYIEKILGKKADVLTPAGIKGIRIKSIAEDIEKSAVYV